MFRYLVLIGVAAGIAAYFLVLRPELAKTEESLSVVASQVAGRQVSIKCQGLISDAIDVSNREGEVELDENGELASTAELKRGICKRLGDFEGASLDAQHGCLVSADECPKDVEKNVVAINTLSHESWHLAGVKDERIAECYAMQTNELVAVRVGATAGLARAMAVYYATEIYPHLSTTYRTNSCRNGGPYDLHRGSPAWP